MSIFGKKKKKKKAKGEVIMSDDTGRPMVVSDDTAANLRRNKLFIQGGGRLVRHGRGHMVITPKRPKLMR